MLSFFSSLLLGKNPQNSTSQSQLLHLHHNRIMEQAKMLRRTIGRLAKEVHKHHDRISVNAMLDLSAQIKRSTEGTFFLQIQFRLI